MVWYLSYMSPLHVHGDVSSREKDLNFGLIVLSIYVYSYFVYASSEGSNEYVPSLFASA